MDNMEISTEPTFLEVELPPTLLESPSVSTFLPDEEASICPLLSSNGGLGPVLLTHPLSPNIVASDITSSNISNTDCKAETSSSGSSDGIAMDALDTTSTSLFNKVNYHHLQNNNNASQDASSHCLKGNRNKSKDTPSFVSWNWPLIRKCTFFVFVSVILGICAIVVAQIASMPTSCNPKTAWYRGSVFYEIDPASFQDTDNDGVGDINGIIQEIDYLSTLGIAAVRLNSIFPAADGHLNVAPINLVRHQLGNLSAVRTLANLLHANNMTLLLDLPLQNVFAGRRDDEVLDAVGQSLLHWLDQGVDGFYIKGLESIADHAALLRHLAKWQRLVGPNRVLIVGETFLKNKSQAEVLALLEHIDLVDFALDPENDSQKMKARVDSILQEMPMGDDKTWIHWSITSNHLDKLNTTPSISAKVFAATIMQLMLPGSPNILHANEKAIAEERKHQSARELSKLMNEGHHNETDERLDPVAMDRLRAIHRMIDLRERSPSIYKNVVCKSSNSKANTQIMAHSKADIFIVVRNYPRKNSFVSITNFGSTKVIFDLTSKFYSGTRMLISGPNEKIYFKQFTVEAFNTIVVKLDK